MPNFLLNDGYFRSETKNDQTIALLSKKTSKRSVSPVSCTFEKFWQKIHTKSPTLSLNDQKTWAKFLHSRETPQNCSCEHFESSSDILASIFSIIVQNFLLRIRKWFKKTIFLQTFSSIFFRISRLFPWYPDFFVKNKQNCSNSKTVDQIQHFFKKIYFSS